MNKNLMYTTITESMGITVKHLIAKYGPKAVRRDAEDFLRAWYAGSQDYWKGHLTSMQLAEMSVRLDYYRKPARKFEFPTHVQVINGSDLLAAYYGVSGREDCPPYASIARVFDLMEHNLSALPDYLGELEHLYIDQWAEIPKNWAWDEYNHTAIGAKFLAEYSEIGYCECEFAENGSNTGLFHYFAAWMNLFASMSVVASVQPQRLYNVVRKIKRQDLSKSWKRFFSLIEETQAHDDWDNRVAQLVGTALGNFYAALGITLTGLLSYRADTKGLTYDALNRMFSYADALDNALDQTSEWVWTTDEFNFPVSYDSRFARHHFSEDDMRGVFERAQDRARSALNNSKTTIYVARAYTKA